MSSPLTLGRSNIIGLLYAGRNVLLNEEKPKKERKRENNVGSDRSISLLGRPKNKNKLSKSMRIYTRDDTSSCRITTAGLGEPCHSSLEISLLFSVEFHSWRSFLWRDRLATGFTIWRMKIIFSSPLSCPPCCWYYAAVFRRRSILCLSCGFFLFRVSRTVGVRADGLFPFGNVLIWLVWMAVLSLEWRRSSSLNQSGRGDQRQKHENKRTRCGLYSPGFSV